MQIKGYSISKRELLALIEAQKWDRLRREMRDWHPHDVADVFAALSLPQARETYNKLASSKAAKVFPYLDIRIQKRILSEASQDERTHIIESLSPDDRTTLLERLPERLSLSLIASLSTHDRKVSQHLLQYEEDSVGRLMTTEYVAIRPGWSAREALAHIRSQGHNSETIHRLYVTDEDGKLIDDIRLRTLLFADPKARVETLIDGNFVSLSPDEHQRKAVHAMRTYDLFAIPVIDKAGKLLGIVTHDDVLEVAEEEATEDVQRLGSISPLRTSYKQSSVLQLYHRRVWWLCGLVLVGLISAGVISRYEEILASAIALAFFIPMLMGSGGNTGSQSATMMVRALATGDVKMSEWLRVLSKELLIGLFIGLTLGLLAGMIGFAQGGYIIGVIVGLTMLSIILVTNLMGMVLPFVLSKLRIDPAVASAPLIASIADAIGLLLYFTIAIAVLGSV